MSYSEIFITAAVSLALFQCLAVIPFTFPLIVLKELIFQISPKSIFSKDMSYF